MELAEEKWGADRELDDEFGQGNLRKGTGGREIEFLLLHCACAA